jgi:CBS domain-containing protein
MLRIQELLERKGHRVITIDPQMTVLDAAVLMNNHRIGAVVVVEQQRVVGMFTERDVLLRVVAEQREPAKTFVSEVMTTDVVCCTPDTTAEEARGAMRDRRIRHLPVADANGQLLGLISIGDLNANLQATQEQTLFLLTEYLYGRA